MTEMFGEAWPPMSVPDLAPDDDDPPARLCVFLVKWHNASVYGYDCNEGVAACVIIFSVLLNKLYHRKRDIFTDAFFSS